MRVRDTGHTEVRSVPSGPRLCALGRGRSEADRTTETTREGVSSEADSRLVTRPCALAQGQEAEPEGKHRPKWTWCLRGGARSA